MQYVAQFRVPKNIIFAVVLKIVGSVLEFYDIKWNMVGAAVLP
jgi:hypothetical protein